VANGVRYNSWQLFEEKGDPGKIPHKRISDIKFKIFFPKNKYSFAKAFCFFTLFLFAG